MSKILSFLYNVEKVIIIIIQFFQKISLYFSKKKKSDFKIFCIGYPKTGTTSLAEALDVIGYSVLDWPRAYIKPKKGWVNYFKKSKFDAFSDAPLNDPGLFKKLDKTFPNSKFILTLRDEDSLIRSWRFYFYGTEWEVGSKYNESHIRNYYREHNKEVLEYFKSKKDKLLVLNIFEEEDLWDKLCDFLDCKKPSNDFPHKNKVHYRKFIAKKLLSKD